MNSPAVLIATARIRAGSEDSFASWKGRHDALVATFPGFCSSDVLPPGDHDDKWTFLLNFDSTEHLTGWQQSNERATILSELATLIIGGDFGEVMQTESAAAAQPGTMVTQVIFSRVKPGMEASYRAWAARMQQAQARYAGYRGMFFQPPAPGGNHWISMLRFATTEQMDAWMAAPERATMLEEASAFIEGEELLRLATSFPGWVRIDPETGQGPPNWKTALLVLLGLYPIVATEMLYLSPLLRGLIPALGIFVSNVVSVAATSFVTMPFLVRAFDRWLFVGTKKGARASKVGAAILIACFACEIAFIAALFRWQTGR